MKNELSIAVLGLLLAVLLLMANLAVSSPSFASGQTGDLWRQAVVHLHDNCYLPGKVAIDEEVLDKRGKLYEHRRYSFLVKPDGPQRVKPHLITAFTNGINAMDTMRPEIEKPVPVRTWLEESPLFPSSRESLTAEPIGRDKTVDGIRCIGFGFKGSGPMGSIEGTAWLSADDGLPVQVESVVVSVPVETDVLWITSYSQTDRYGRTSDGVCVLNKRRVFSGIREDYLITSFEGTADITYTFSDHWRYQLGSDTVIDNNHLKKRLP